MRIVDAAYIPYYYTLWKPEFQPFFAQFTPNSDFLVICMIFSFYTLGCKVNQYETQAMEQELLRRGHQLAPFTALCDCYIINSCTVTAVSDKKNRSMIRQAKRRNPNAVIAVCGCYAQTQPDAVKALGVDVISGTGDRMAFLDALERAALGAERPAELVGPSKELRSFELLPPGSLEGRTRAMLKVQDGCDNYCTYCIIPYARVLCAACLWSRLWPSCTSWRRWGIGSASSPASKSPPGVRISSLAGPWWSLLRPSVRRSRRCAFAWAPWSPVLWTRTFAPGCVALRTYVPSST